MKIQSLALRSWGVVLFGAVLLGILPAMTSFAQQITVRRARPAPQRRLMENNFRRPIRNLAG